MMLTIQNNPQDSTADVCLSDLTFEVIIDFKTSPIIISISVHVHLHLHFPSSYTIHCIFSIVWKLISTQRKSDYYRKIKIDFFRKCFFLFQHFFGGCMRLSSEPDLTFMSGSSYHQNTMALPPVFAANICDVISPEICDF